MLERKSLECQSIKMFQQFPSFSFCTGPYTGEWGLRAVAAPCQDVGMARDRVCPWHGSGGQAGAGCSHKGQLQKDPHPPPMWPPTPCRRYVWLRFCPKAIRTCLPPSSCVSSDSWRYLRSSTVPFCFSLLLTTSPPLKRQVLNPIPFRHDPHVHSV